MFLDWVLLEPANNLSPFRTQSILTSTIFFSCSNVASRVATFPLCGEPAEKANSFSVSFFLLLGVVQTLVNSSYSVSFRFAGREGVLSSCFILCKTASSKSSSSSTTSTFFSESKSPPLHCGVELFQGYNNFRV